MTCRREIVKALVIPGEAAAKMSRTEIEKLEAYVKSMGAKGLARAKGRRRGKLGPVPSRKKMITDGLRTAIQYAHLCQGR